MHVARAAEADDTQFPPEKNPTTAFGKAGGVHRRLFQDDAVYRNDNAIDRSEKVQQKCEWTSVCAVI
jgi:hypothetical protein